MSSVPLSIVFVTLLYKVCCLLTGAFFAYMGFRLFLAGATGSAASPDAGSIDASAAKFHFTLTRAAPGTFFVLFGTAIVAFTVYTRMDFDLHSGALSNTSDHVSSSSLPATLPP